MTPIDQKITDDVIYEFEDYTSYPLSQYLLDFDNFVKNHYQNLISYYRGSVNDLNQESVDRLTRLDLDRLALSNKLNQYIGDFSSFEYWILLEYLEEIGVKIQQAKVISKFLRSSKYEGFNENSLVQNYSMSNYDTLETIAKRSRDDEQNSWVDIALKNNLLETDYVAGEGGKNLLLSKKALNNLFLESVVDNLIDERVYGLDFDNDFIYDSVTEDIKILGYRETFTQAVNVLANLNKGELPEFPTLGLSTSLVVGGNLADFSIPFVLREMEETFSTDDTIVDYNIEDFKREGSTIFINFKVSSFYNKVFKTNRQLQL